MPTLEEYDSNTELHDDNTSCSSKEEDTLEEQALDLFDHTEIYTDDDDSKAGLCLPDDGKQVSSDTGSLTYYEFMARKDAIYKKSGSPTPKKQKKQKAEKDNAEHLMFEKDSYEDDGDASAFTAGNKYNTSNQPSPGEGRASMYQFRINRSAEFIERTRGEEFNGKFLIHVLDDGVMRIRDKRRWFADNKGVIRKRTKPTWKDTARESMRQFLSHGSVSVVADNRKRKAMGRKLR